MTAYLLLPSPTRQTIEASLIVAILLQLVVKLNRPELKKFGKCLLFISPLGIFVWAVIVCFDVHAACRLSYPCRAYYLVSPLQFGGAL